MNDNYQKMSELLDNLLSYSEKEMKIALIEKEILLEKMRKLYVHFSQFETEEYEAPKTEIAQPSPEPKREYTPAKTLEEDVDLFFDTEHESYAGVAQELKELAEEIEGQVQPASVEEPKKAEPEPVAETDLFDKIEDNELSDDENKEEIRDNAEELFLEKDFEITAQPEAEEEQTHAEDDILQFIPPKSALKSVPEPPVKSAAEPQPVKVQETPIPTPKKPEPKPVAEKPAMPKEETPAKPKRSLNDLFNEQREDHSISSQYQRAKVGDLTKAISINDKFIYIKELFHNRGEDFSASIRLLNECTNMEQAFDCLEQLKQKFFWDSKSDAYLSFCDLLRRKYS